MNNCSGRVYIFVVLFCTWLISSIGLSADIKGEFKLNKEKLKEKYGVRIKALNKEYKGYWQVANGIIPVRDEEIDPLTHIGIILEPSGTQLQPEPMPTVTVTLADSMVIPQVIIVTPDTEIRFRNRDPFVHALYSSDYKEFTPLLQQYKEIRHFRFNKVGTFVIKDQFFPHIFCWIVVVNTPFVGRIEKNKDREESYLFEIKGVPVGNYKLRLFFGGEWIDERGVEVKDEKEVKLNFEIPFEEKEGGEKTEEKKEGKKEEVKGEKGGGEKGERKRRREGKRRR